MKYLPLILSGIAVLQLSLLPNVGWANSRKANKLENRFKAATNNLVKDVQNEVTADDKRELFVSRLEKALAEAHQIEVSQEIPEEAQQAIADTATMLEEYINHPSLGEFSAAEMDTYSLAFAQEFQQSGLAITILGWAAVGFISLFIVASVLMAIAHG